MTHCFLIYYYDFMNMNNSCTVEVCGIRGILMWKWCIMVTKVLSAVLSLPPSALDTDWASKHWHELWNIFNGLVTQLSLVSADHLLSDVSVLLLFTAPWWWIRGLSTNWPHSGFSVLAWWTSFLHVSLLSNGIIYW